MLEHYKFSEREESFTYQFTSEGSKGKITKIVRFRKFSNADYFHFGFGDWNEELKMTNSSKNIPFLDPFEGFITFPAKYADAVEMYINVPIPGRQPLTALEKIATLLQEIECVNKHIGYYQKEEKPEQVAFFANIKKTFVSLLIQIMQEQYQIDFLRQAA